jgi:glycosyltransferase involved in cell wall biosynthesis
MEKFISVIIPTLNSEETIDECLNSIYVNVNAPQFDVTIVDGGSTDKTVEIAQKYPAKIMFAEKAQANQRNAGAAQAKGDILAFTDSDTRVCKDWLSRLATYFDDPSITGVGGPNITHEEDPFWATCFGILIESFLGSAGVRNTVIYKEIREVDHNPPVNSAVRKNIFLEVGGFTRGFEPTEDVMLDAKIKKTGGKLIYDPDMVVWHHRRRTLKGFARQLRQYGRGRASVFYQYPQSLPLTYFCVALFALGTIFSIPLYFLVDILQPVISYGWLTYLVFIVISSSYIAINRKRPILAAVLPPLAFIEHFSLGIGFVIGLIAPLRIKK